jgi:hypothetical protein
LKSKGRAKWRRFYSEHSKPGDREVAALLKASWEALSDSVISATWDFDEVPAELDSDDSSDDDEFELALDSNRHGRDENASDRVSEDDPETNKHDRLNSFGPTDIVDFPAA